MGEYEQDAKKRWEEAHKKSASKNKSEKRGKNFMENVSGFVKGVKAIYGGRGSAEKIKAATDE